MRIIREWWGSQTPKRRRRFMVVGILDIGVVLALAVTGAYLTAAILFVGVAAMVGWGEWMLARQGPKNSN